MATTTPRVPDPPKPDTRTDTPRTDAAKTGDGKARTTAPATHTGDTKFFEGTIVKIDAEGREVLSDTLAEGERLRRDTTDRYSAVRATPPDADKKTDQ